MAQSDDYSNLEPEKKYMGNCNDDDEPNAFLFLWPLHRLGEYGTASFAWTMVLLSACPGPYLALHCCTRLRYRGTSVLGVTGGIFFSRALDFLTGPPSETMIFYEIWTRMNSRIRIKTISIRTTYCMHLQGTSTCSSYETHVLLSLHSRLFQWKRAGEREKVGLDRFQTETIAPRH